MQDKLFQMKPGVAQILRKSAPTAGELVRDICRILPSLGLWIDWIHPRSVQEYTVHSKLFSKDDVQLTEASYEYVLLDRDAITKLSHNDTKGRRINWTLEITNKCDNPSKQNLKRPAKSICWTSRVVFE